MDYQSNSNKSKESKPQKKVERAIHSEVLVQKKSVGRKFKDLFIEADPRSVAQFIFYEVIVPAARNMIFDAWSRGGERIMYGEKGSGRQRLGAMTGTRITYNNPVNRGFSNAALSRPALTTRQPMLRSQRDSLIFGSREEAALVIERMNDIIDSYEVVSVADLNDLVGLPTSHVDNKWGWSYLGDVQVRQVREGFIIDLPPAEPIQ